MDYESRGGIKSIDFTSSELERAGAALRNCSVSLREAAVVLGASALAIPTAVLGTLTLRFKLLAAQRELATLGAVSLRLCTEAGALALKVATARHVYELAEARSAALAERAGNAALGLRLLFDLAGPNGRPGTSATEELVERLPELLGRLAVLLPAAGGLGLLLPMLGDRRHGGLFDDSVARRLHPLLGRTVVDAGLVRLGPVNVDSVREAAPRALVPGLPGLMELQERAEQAPPGSLLVTTVPTANGPLHIVTIPGTQGRELVDPALLPKLPGREAGLPLLQNPWDNGGIVESLGLGSQHTAAAVSRALAESGARAGERVIFSGYSQGGIHAANLAVDPRITGTYQVPYVLSVGAPVAGIELPPSVRGLHLQDRADPVPGMDGAPNPAVRHRITLTFENAGDAVANPDSVFGPAHQLKNYSRHVAALTRGQDPVADEALSALGVLFLGAGAATVRTVQLRRSGPVPVLRAAPPKNRTTSKFRRDWAPGP